MTAVATGTLWSGGLGKRARPAPNVLALGQIRWIGALILAAQLPQAPHLPVWIALFGMTLVAMRMWFAARDARRPDAPPTRIPSWALVLFAIIAAWFVRVSFGGHLVGRDPSVAFLFILVGVKFLEARSRRDGTLLVCLAMFMLITPFLSDQSAVAALAVLPATILLGATLEALARDHTSTPTKSAIKRSLLLLLQGIPLAAVLFVLFPRLSAPLWGLPQDYAAQSGLSDTMAPGMISELSLSDAVAFRVDFDGPPRRRRCATGGAPCLPASMAVCGQRCPPAVKAALRAVRRISATPSPSNPVSSPGFLHWNCRRGRPNSPAISTTLRPDEPRS